jgi:hypothetical protein
LLSKLLFKRPRVELKVDGERRKEEKGLRDEAEKGESEAGMTGKGSL